MDIGHTVQVVPLQHAMDCVAEWRARPPSENVPGSGRIGYHHRHVVGSRRHNLHVQVGREPEVSTRRIVDLPDRVPLPAGHVENACWRRLAAMYCSPAVLEMA